MCAAKILLHVTGSISAYKANTLCSMLVQKDFDVRVSVSENAHRFCGISAFEGSTGKRVVSDMFAGIPDERPHITLAQNWADLIIVYPASANCITRLAAGLCDDLFGSICLANNYHKPVLIAPAMNSEMFANPAVQEALQKLSRWGAHILPTEDGVLACGAKGPGRLIDCDTALTYIEGFLCTS